jgi:hypothetical protein
MRLGAVGGYVCALACKAWASWRSLPGRTPYFRKKARLNAACVQHARLNSPASVRKLAAQIYKKHASRRRMTTEIIQPASVAP